MTSIYTEQIGQGTGSQPNFSRILMYIPSSMTAVYFKILINSEDLHVSIVDAGGGIYNLVEASYLNSGSYNSSTRVLSLSFKTAPLETDFISAQYQIDSQKLSFQYGGEGRSAYFNTILHKLLPMGVYAKEAYSENVYSYSHGNLEKLTDYVVSISPFIALLRDVENDLSVRLETLSTINVYPTPESPYVCIRINWVNSTSNYADIVTVPFAGIQVDYIVLGKCFFDGDDKLMDYFDYTRRNNIDIENDKIRTSIPFRVLATEPPTHHVSVSEGFVTFSTGEYKVDDGTLSPSLTDTVAGRIDLVYIDQTGDVQVFEGIDNASPETPEFAGKFVVAEIRRVGAWSTVEGHHIKQIDSYRYFVNDNSHPTFDRITLLLPPVDDSDAVRKDYVDNLIRGLDWQESVIDFLDFTTSEPSSRTDGDRYVNTATGTGSSTGQGVVANNIYQWDNTHLLWQEAVVDEGTVLLNETTNIQWLFNGTIWVQFSTTINHNNLGCLQGGTTDQYYHMTSLQCQNAFYRNTHTTDNITEGSTNRWYSDTLVNANGHVTCAYDHALVTGNPHSTVYSQISDFQAGVCANSNVIAAKAHADIVSGNPHNVTKGMVSLGNVDNVQQIPLVQKGAANGVACLDSNGLVPVSQIPSDIGQSLKYKGTWNACTNTPTLPGTPTKGDYYVISQDGTTTLTGGGNVWRIGDWATYNGTSWNRVKYRDEITSVNGYTIGDITLTTSDIAEGSRMYYTEERVSANSSVVSAVNHITSDGSSHSLFTTIQSEITDENNSGFISWLNSGAYYSIVTTTFNLLRGGTGRVKGALVTWAGSQSTTLVAGLNIICVNSSGIITSFASYVPSVYEDNIPLFKVYYDSAFTLTVKSNYYYKFNTTAVNYLTKNVGGLVKGTGGNIDYVTYGDGSEATDRQIKVVGQAILNDNELETTISDSSGGGISLDFLYKNGSGIWKKDSTGSSFSMKYNNSGTITSLVSGEFAIWTVYALKDSINSANGSYIAIANTSKYSTEGDAKTAIKLNTVTYADGAISDLNPALLGFVVVKYNANGGFISKVYPIKAMINYFPIPYNGSDFVTDDGTNTNVASPMEVDGATILNSTLNVLGLATFQGQTEVSMSTTNPYIILRKTGTNAGYVKIMYNSSTGNVEYSFG